jgi:phosphoglycerate dehydrogenase-like enzyme
MPRPRIHVGPDGQEWFEPAIEAVKRGGGQPSEAHEARAVVWLEMSVDGLQARVHDGIEWVQLRAAGVDRWLAEDALDRDRVWTAAQGVYSSAVAEHALTLLLAGAKQLHRSARATSWNAEAKWWGDLIEGATVTVVGAGGIGTRLIHYLVALDARVIAVTRSGRTVPGAAISLPAHRLSEVWPVADHVVLAAPATDETRYLVGGPELAAMKENAWLVNIARGSMVDQDALVEALRTGRLGGAALDVTEPEPLPDDHPLWDEPRAIITPHVANPGSAQLPRLMARIEENVRRFVAGEPLLGQVDLDAGY